MFNLLGFMIRFMVGQGYLFYRCYYIEINACRRVVSIPRGTSLALNDCSLRRRLNYYFLFDSSKQPILVHTVNENLYPCM